MSLGHQSQFFDDFCINPVNVIHAASIAGEKDELAIKSYARITLTAGRIDIFA